MFYGAYQWHVKVNNAVGLSVCVSCM